MPTSQGLSSEVFLGCAAGVVAGATLASLASLYGPHRSPFSVGSTKPPPHTSRTTIAHQHKAHDLITRMLCLFEETWGNSSTDNSKLGKGEDGSSTVKVSSSEENEEIPFVFVSLLLIITRIVVAGSCRKVHGVRLTPGYPQGFR